VILLGPYATAHVGGLDDGTIVPIDQPGTDGSPASIHGNDTGRLTGESESHDATFDTRRKVLKCLDSAFAPVESVLLCPARIRHVGSIWPTNLGDANAVEVNHDRASTSGADLNGRKKWARILQCA
jgi:hypothetical protein